MPSRMPSRSGRHLPDADVCWIFGRELALSAMSGHCAGESGGIKADTSSSDSNPTHPQRSRGDPALTMNLALPRSSAQHALEPSYKAPVNNGSTLVNVGRRKAVHRRPKT